MKVLKRTVSNVILVLALCLLCVTAAAESGDNSLSSLGLGVGECSPEFYYSTLEYTITVPAGTTELTLDPVTSDANASIVDISGTQLEADGTGTVFITVEAPNGAQVTYTLNVVPDGEAPAPETEAAQTELSEEQKMLEEQQRMSESEEALRQQAEIEQNKQQVAALTTQNEDLNKRLDLLMKVLYGLVAFAVILLFLVINQCLRNKDLKEDLKDARNQAEANNEFARKEQTMQNNYYYTPHQNMQSNASAAPQMQQGMPQPVEEATQNVQAAFGNASQTLYSRPAPGQVSAPAQPQAQDAPEEPQPQGAPAKPQLVQGETEEPDVNVEMIDL